MRATVASRGVTVDQRELVERASNGDHDAFAVLVGVSVARLEAVARLILRDQELARDAVQDALIRAWRDLPGLRDPERFDAWLHRLLVNARLDLARRRGRRRPGPAERGRGAASPPRPLPHAGPGRARGGGRRPVEVDLLSMVPPAV